MQKVKTFFLQTFGCQQNLSDSERICAILENNQYQETKDIQEADMIIFNTCSIKQHAEDRVIGFIKNAHALRKIKPRIIGVTGCMIRKTSTQKSLKKDQTLRRSRFIDFVFRIEDAVNLPLILDNISEQTICSTNIGENLESFFSITPKLNKPFSAFVPIMTGCNKFCTYCIVPYSRGQEQSRPFHAIIEECRHLVDKGVIEITLLGQNVNAYYLDDNQRKNRKNHTDFAYLLNEVAKINNLQRIRFCSPHPSQMTNDVIDVMAENENICNHLHLPVQSGSDEILGKMNRSHTKKDFQKIIAYARKRIPDIAISTDLIVGFPGESNDHFEESRKLCEEEKFDIIYISKFSPRQGTLAAKMVDDVPLDEKKRRYAIIQELLIKTSISNNQQWLNQEVEVLIEEITNDQATGKTSQYKTVHCPANNLKPGDLVMVKIINAQCWFLRGEVI